MRFMSKKIGVYENIVRRKRNFFLLVLCSIVFFAMSFLIPILFEDYMGIGVIVLNFIMSFQFITPVMLPFFLIYYFVLRKKLNNLYCNYPILHLDNEIQKENTLYFKRIKSYLSDEYLIVNQEFPTACRICNLLEFTIREKYDYINRCYYKYIVFLTKSDMIIINRCQPKLLNSIFNYKKNKEMLSLYYEINKIKPDVFMNYELQEYLEYKLFKKNNTY